MYSECYDGNLSGEPDGYVHIKQQVHSTCTIVLLAKPTMFQSVEACLSKKILLCRSQNTLESAS